MKSLFNYMWSLEACETQANWYAAVSSTCRWAE